ncbi:sensor histidine kinase [Betaproteobacteria bacterium GR16-43]|nr:sensor histidine kinase [Betaproteobacteria bacterium GR16-43]
MASINQTGAGIRLPNFCNLGVMLRALLVVNLFVFAAAAMRTRTLDAYWFEFLLLAAFVEPVLLLSLVVLCAARRPLHAMGYVPAILSIAAFEVAVAWVLSETVAGLIPDRPPLPFFLVAFLALFATFVTLLYFDLRARALSPAIAEARIQALQARIRPHFLYNSINAALSLIRTEPRRAEQVLEDLADLFRVLMADNRTLAPLGDEVSLARQYLAIEQLRLGERLRIRWNVDGMPAEALVPPLILQPLVENAVYHGIEPADGGGEIAIDIRKSGEQVHMTLTNPFSGTNGHPGGNKMAMANIRERLQLHFDVEASLKSEVVDGQYRVTIRLPYIKAST